MRDTLLFIPLEEYSEEEFDRESWRERYFIILFLRKFGGIFGNSVQRPGYHPNEPIIRIEIAVSEIIQARDYYCTVKWPDSKPLVAFQRLRISRQTEFTVHPSDWRTSRRR